MGRSGIRFVIARHEQAAAHAADGYARATGKPGVLLMHVGPGMTNAVTGVLTAALDSVPLVAIAGDVPSYYLRPAPAPGGQPPRRRRPDRDLPAVRQAGLARAPGRRTWPGSPSAPSGRRPPGGPGAVLLNVPMDLFSRPVPPDAAAVPAARSSDRARPARPTSPTASPTLLVGAERPLVYLGGGLRRGAGLTRCVGSSSTSTFRWRTR